MESRTKRLLAGFTAAAALVFSIAAFALQDLRLFALAVILLVPLLVWLYLPRRAAAPPAAPASTGAPRRDVVRPVPPTSHEGAPSEPPSAAPTAVPRVRPALPELRFPATLECDSVLQVLLDNARAAGNASSASLWLSDDTTASLRLVASAGLPPVSSAPVQRDDIPLGTALTGGTAVLEPVPGAAEAAGTPSRWRYALPVGVNGTRGVVALDFDQADVPDTGILTRLSAMMRGALAGCLALRMARAQLVDAEDLVDAARSLSRLLDPTDVVEGALGRAVSLTHASTASVMLLGDDGKMRIAAAFGLPDDVVRTTEVSEGEGIAGWVLATRQPLLVEDLPGRGGGRRHGVRSAVSVPLADEDGVVGVLNVGSRAFPARYTSSHLEALETLGRQTAVALRNARAVSTARELYFSTLRALALAMETKDPYASGGTDRVLDLSLELGRAMGLDADEIQALEVAALLHDIGMSAAGDTLTVADRPLSTVERGLLKMHPVIAAEIIDQAPALELVAPIVYHHHEWYDGGGYVAGLSGEAIPLGARILAVADAFVAMTSSRPYRPAMSANDALAELKDNAGTQFDPNVVAAFEEVSFDSAERSSAARDSGA